MKKRILVFCDYYKPGYKSGGGMWTVVNLIDRFCHQYDFYVVTRDHDGISDTEPYTSVKIGQWNRLENESVFYSSERGFSIRRIAELFHEIKPDAVFLNSAFSLPVRTFLNARRKNLLGPVPVILAPCGEMSEGALSLKPLKKKAFLKLARLIGLYSGIIWKASFDSEADEVKRQFGNEITVMSAPDLAPRSILPEFDFADKPTKVSGSARFAFISRLTRKKNIHYFLERLLDVRIGNIELDIIGPLEDAEYWTECQSIISRLPQNIKVTATGAYPNQQDALKKLSESHFFVLPTLNENFGYVFVEALAAGCPILTSENTVWKDVDDLGIGWVTCLADREDWLKRIDDCVAMGPAEYEKMSLAARSFALDWLGRPEHDEATALVLDHALGQYRTVAR